MASLLLLLVLSWFLLRADIAIIAASDQSTIMTSNVCFLLIAQLAIIAANDQSTIINSSDMVLIDSSPCSKCS